MTTTLTPPSGFTPRALTTWNKYFIPSTDTNVYRVGDAVKSAGGTDAVGIVAVTLHLGTGPARGVIVAVDPGLPATGGLVNNQKQSVPAAKLNGYYVWVDDDPSHQFAMVDDGLTPANSVGTAAGKFANFTPGASAAANGGSSAAITSSTLGSTSGCLQVISLSPGSAYGAAATWLVKFSAHELANGGSSTGPGTGISTLAAAPDYTSALVTPVAAATSAAAAAQTAAASAQATATSATSAASAAGTTATAAQTAATTAAAAVANALKAPTSWAASPSGGSPALSSGTAVLGSSYQNTTAGTTVLTTPIDGITQVAFGDILLALASGTYTLFPSGGAFYGIVATPAALPAGTALAATALVGSAPPYAIWQTNGSVWVQQITSALLGVANGAASLDSTGKLPAAQLPAVSQGALAYQGAWNASTNSPALASGTGTKGYYYTVAVAGTTTLDGISQWAAGDHATFNGTAWEKFDGLASEVLTVAGRTGNVVIGAGDVAGLAASATTDTTNASNISAGTLPLARLVNASASSTAIALGGITDYQPLTIGGPTAITISGSTRGAQASMLVIADGTNVPTVSGADEWGTSFGYLNMAGIPNRLDVWYDDVSARFTWTQQAVPVSLYTLLQSAAVSGATLTMAYNQALNTTAPAPSAFSVVGAGGVTQTPTAVSITGSTVSLTLATPAVNANTVTVSYTVPGTNPIQSAAGVAAAALSSQAVTNNTSVAIALSSEVVNGASLTLTYNQSLNTTAPAASAYSVVGAGGVTQTPTAVSISGAAVTLTLGTAAVAGNTVTVSYTAPGTNPVTSSNGQVAANLSGQAVTNSTGGYQAETTAWLNRVSTAGGTVSTATQNAVDAFVSGCKTDGTFSLLRRLNLVCGDYTASQVPLVNTSGSATDTMVGMTSADYSESLGWTTDGTSKVVKTGYVPSEATGGLSAYVRTTQASDTNGRVPIGVQSATPAQGFRIAGNRGSTGASVAGNTAGVWGGNGATAGNQAAINVGLTAGFWHDARSSSSANALMFNGNSQATSTPVDTPAAPSTYDLWVMALNNSGAYASGLASGSRLSAYGVDTGMTTAQASLFYSRMQTFQTALSRNV